MRPYGLILALACAPLTLAAQQAPAGVPAGQPVAAMNTPMQQTAPAPQPAPPPPPTEPENYTYEPDGRRDPFLNLLGTGPEPRLGAQRPDGAGGIAVAELSVRGIMRSRGAYIAQVQGPDNRAYVVRQGDKLLDGVIKTITAQGIVIVQDVNDPLSLVKQREVVKRLRSLEDVQ